ncbi:MULTISPECIES: hypothetical protein [unclassified Pseudomonas]|uniref:hypothetical protein n=1 Tax=unclassified Pseudomonas TaxID=196821 RepID=UPI002AC8FD4C|nr:MULTISPECIES: hypothetical protein [unclassified Pseudomonas]MEB0042070.1 hypothetical protein [Pseudomonas sp. MH10]MEB0076545.1 hypothetical protein [Pseudomonas sp. MH10out]MEB0091293.1 hypothetical protein [Pseudomonas sp. CCI4.2]MEB0101501.1 hypothetical protein [Pseudomonas sp. CCI3.2]MEB0119784.1 hypothetical protein [Pseudomonas sp. CCI1.2]
MAIGVISASIPVNVGVTADHQAKFRVTAKSTAFPTPGAATTAVNSLTETSIETAQEAENGVRHTQAGEIINTKI